MGTVTPLAAGEINRADRITVELHTPPNTPPAVLITWPLSATVTTLNDFDEVVERVTELLAEARVVLAFRGRRAR